MDFHLNSLLSLPNTTVFTCYKEAGFIFLHLQLTNEGINCPNCQSYTDSVRDSVKEVCVDMWGGFPKVIKEVFPNAVITIDRFHVMKLVNKS